MYSVKVTNPSFSENLINVSQLPYMANASWSPDRASIPGTNLLVIDDILRWLPGATSISLPHDERIYFLYGSPRCGKSSVSHRIAQILQDDGRLGSAIFLARDVPGRNHSSLIFSTIARDLAAFHDSIKARISEAIKSSPNILSADIARQLPELIIQPTKDLTVIGPVLIIIDGVDELQDATDRRRFLKLLCTQAALLPDNLRILITARSEPDVKSEIARVAYHRRRNMSLDYSCGTDDIRSRIRVSIAELNATVLGNRSMAAVEEKLVERAAEIRFWATTACDFLKIVSKDYAAQFIDHLLSRGLPISPDEAMDNLYDAILQTISHRGHCVFGMEWQVLFQTIIKGQCRSTLEARSHCPVPPNSSCHPINALVKVGCIIDKINPDGSRMLLLHPSFEGFITNSQRCTCRVFVVDMEVDHTKPITERCLAIMNQYFIRDICYVEDTSLLNSELVNREDLLDQFGPASLLYASSRFASY